MKTLVQADELSELRVPPHSLEAEQSVLGSLLLDNLAWDRAGDLLTDGDFYLHEHRLIYAVICSMMIAKKAVDVITVYERLQAAGEADAAGGLVHLNALARCVPSASNMRRYAEIVRDKSLLRNVISFSSDAADLAFKSTDAAATIDRIVTMSSTLDQRLMSREAMPVADLVPDLLSDFQLAADGEGSPGFRVGIPSLDRLLEGLVPGLYYVGARPGIGKTSFTAQIALNLAQEGRRVLFLSMEMGRKQIARRMLANLACIDYTRLKTGKLDDDETSRLVDGADLLRRLPIHIDDQPALRIADIRRKTRALKGVDVVVLDYLQLCSSDLRTDNRNSQIEEISRGLKALSKDMNVPVIALSQLNRKLEERADRKPTMADLRDSGSIEQDADVILFLWQVRELPTAGHSLRGCQVAKNRDGPGGEFGLDFDGTQQRWIESAADIRPTARATRSDL